LHARSWGFMETYVQFVMGGERGRDGRSGSARVDVGLLNQRESRQLPDG